MPDLEARFKRASRSTGVVIPNDQRHLLQHDSLWWLATFGETTVDEIYDREPRSPCTLIFELPSHPTGEVAVTVHYREPPTSGDRAPAGVFTYKWRRDRSRQPMHGLR